VIVPTPKRHRQHGNVVNRARFDERLRGSLGDTVKVRIKLVVSSYDRILLFDSDVEAHDDQRGAGLARRVEVLHSGKLAKQTLHRKCDALLHLPRRCSRHPDEHVEHWYHNLWFFLPWRLQNAEEPQHQRREEEKRSQPRVNEGVCDFSRESLFHYRLSPSRVA